MSPKTTGSAKTINRESPTSLFFSSLASRGFEPMVRNVTGSVRFDVVDGPTTENWFVTMKRGEIAVSNRSAAADVVVRGGRNTIDEITAGVKNAQAALLRGAITVEGNIEVLAQLLRLLPGPPRAESSDDSARRTKP